MAGVAVGVDDCACQLFRLQRVEKTSHGDGLCPVRPTDRVLDHHRIRVIGKRADQSSQPGERTSAVGLLLTAKRTDFIQAWCSDKVDTPRFFTHPPQTGRCLARRSQMDMCHPADGIPVYVVEIADSAIAAVNMAEHAASDGGGTGPGEGLDAIAQDENGLTGQAIETPGDSGHAASKCLSLVRRSLPAGLHADDCINSPAGLADLVDCPAELGQKVHPRDDQARLKTAVMLHGPQDRFEQAKLGSGPCNHGHSKR